MQFPLALISPKFWQNLQQWLPKRMAQAEQSTPQPTHYGLACRTGIKAGQSESTYTVTYTSPTSGVAEE